MARGAFCCRACRVVSPQFFLFRVAAILLLFHSFPLRFAERRLFLALVCLRAPSLLSHRIARGPHIRPCLYVCLSCMPGVSGASSVVRSLSQSSDGRSRMVYG
jgi:hypothetical protein